MLKKNILIIKTFLLFFLIMMVFLNQNLYAQTENSIVIHKSPVQIQVCCNIKTRSKKSKDEKNSIIENPKNYFRFPNFNELLRVFGLKKLINQNLTSKSNEKQNVYNYGLIEPTPHWKGKKDDDEQN